MKLRSQDNSKLFEKSKTCLNCDEQLIGKYCSNCGQKSDTHRITFRNFIEHDILHGAFHLEKGMLFTAKEAMIRPGYAALNYISGKRKRHYNVFLFILLMIGANLFLNHYYDELAFEYFPESSANTNNELGNKLDDLINNNSKLIIFSFVPLAAINSFLLFRRRKFNLSEHIILAGVLLLGILIFSILSTFIAFTDFVPFLNNVSYINGFVPLIVIAYITFGYYQAFRREYSLIGFSYRMFLFWILFFLEIILLFTIAIGFL